MIQLRQAGNKLRRLNVGTTEPSGFRAIRPVCALAESQITNPIACTTSKPALCSKPVIAFAEIGALGSGCMV